MQGYLREYRKDDSDSPYRAIVANDSVLVKIDRGLAQIQQATAQQLATRRLIRRAINNEIHF